jgi:tRNA A37 threonylcarbamoyladenosine synthetase subunit TsaC/SUA5/YrdC
VHWWRGSAQQNRDVDVATLPDEARPPVVEAGAAAVAEALGAGSIVAVPNVGGYSLAVRAGSPEEEARLVELAADPDGPHYAVGQIDDVRALTSGWTDELGTLLQRCWPGPVEVFLPFTGSTDEVDRTDQTAETLETDGAGGDAVAPPADGFSAPGPADEPQVFDGDLAVVRDAAPEYGAWAAVVGMPDGRALRRLCREQGPWRTVPLRFTEAEEVAQAFRADDVALVIDGGRREGPSPTVVDATVTPIRVLREGALPASFIEGTMLMSTRRKLFSRTKKAPAG